MEEIIKEYLSFSDARVDHKDRAILMLVAELRDISDTLSSIDDALDSIEENLGSIAQAANTIAVSHEGPTI